MSPKRIKRFKEVINKRQKDLTVILEDVHDGHNISAILRTCDSIGVQDVYVIFTDDISYCKIAEGVSPLGKRSSGNALKWLDVHYFNTTEACFEAVRQKYDYVFCTHLNEEAKSLYELDCTKSVALLFGNERCGVSQTALSLSDGNFEIPQIGLTQSLNVSVACAVSLYEAYRQRAAANMYDTPSLDAKRAKHLFDIWEEKSKKVAKTKMI